MSHVEGFDEGIGYGVRGRSTSGGNGVYGDSDRGDGVVGDSFGGLGVSGYSVFGEGMYGESSEGSGVYGKSAYNTGVYGESSEGSGVYGKSAYSTGVYGESEIHTGVAGSSHDGHGVVGSSTSRNGVHGVSSSGYGVYGESSSGYGVRGFSRFNYGVYGGSTIGFGVYGNSDSGFGVYGNSDSGWGVYGRSRTGYAALLDGRVFISGSLEKPGGSFKIDHPLDPANKYLSHSFVESPDMKNVYDGVVVLDNKGEVEIDLPDWFGILNKDFRYQLTAIGAPGPNLYIAEKISDTTTSNKNNNNSRFKIAGGTSGMEVSWQVTGIRRDPWANANQIRVEEDKPTKERGYYLHPELYGQPEENGISHLLFPKEKQEQIISEKKPNL